MNNKDDERIIMIVPDAKPPRGAWVVIGLLALMILGAVVATYHAYRVERSIKIHTTD